MSSLFGRSLLQDADLSAEEMSDLLELSASLREEKRSGRERARLVGKNIALVFEKASTRTRSAFDVAAHDQGAHTTLFSPQDTHIGEKESVADYARVMGRMFDGIQFRGHAHSDVEALAAHSGVPVWNGLTDDWHPSQALADLLTMRDHSSRPLRDTVVTYCGDARNNVANSLLVSAAIMGMDVRLAAPAALQPAESVRSVADRLASTSGARITITDDVHAAVRDADFLYTDVWVSMGESEEIWAERIELLMPYQVNADLVRATGVPSTKFLHCLPAFHNLETGVGRAINERFGYEALEVTDEVFESSASIVFDQAENRLHTTKALLVATLGAALG